MADNESKEKNEKKKAVKVKVDKPTIKKAKVVKPKKKEKNSNDKTKQKKDKKSKAKAKTKAKNEILSPEAAYKKKSIPEHIRTLVWNLWIGEDIPRAKCMCCKATEIHLRHFQAGHVVAEANGGTSEICNLRPICQPCNLAMGTRNMDEFIATFGLAVAAAKKA